MEEEFGLAHVTSLYQHVYERVIDAKHRAGE